RCPASHPVAKRQRRLPAPGSPRAQPAEIPEARSTFDQSSSCNEHRICGTDHSKATPGFLRAGRHLVAADVRRLISMIDWYGRSIEVSLLPGVLPNPALTLP